MHFGEEAVASVGDFFVFFVFGSFFFL